MDRKVDLVTQIGKFTANAEINQMLGFKSLIRTSRTRQKGGRAQSSKSSKIWNRRRNTLLIRSKSQIRRPNVSQIFALTGFDILFLENHRRSRARSVFPRPDPTPMTKNENTCHNPYQINLQTSNRIKKQKIDENRDSQPRA